MKATNFFGLCMVCAGLTFLACQKDDLAVKRSNDPVTFRDATCGSTVQPVQVTAPTQVCVDEEFVITATFNCGRLSLEQSDSDCDGDFDVIAGFECYTDGSVSTGTLSFDIPGTYTFRTHRNGSDGNCDGLGGSNQSGNCTPTSAAFCCFSIEVVACDEEVCYETESAWADGTRYQNPGNWATYTAYDATNGTTVTLYAGQTMDAGTVDFAPCDNGDVEITITLNDGWSFNPDKAPNTLSIQGYSSAPAGNPAPGQFDHQFNAGSSPITVTVPCADFFGVHADVRVEVECPE